MIFPHSEPVPTEDRASWLSARSRGIGGSDVSAILGLNRWKSPREVWLEKTDRATEKVRTWPMMRGIALEAPLIEWFEDHTGIPVARPIAMQRNIETPWMLVNLDGASADGGIVEVKTANWWMRHEWEDDQVSDHAELQSQWGMAVTGREHAWVIAAISDDDPTWKPVQRDQALIDLEIETCARFWHDNVLGDREPDAVAMDLPELRKRPASSGVVCFGKDPDQDAAAEYVRAHAEVKAAEERKKDAAARLIQTMGDASHLVVDGRVVATRTTFSKAGYEVLPRTETRLTVPANPKPWKRTA